MRNAVIVVLLVALAVPALALADGGSNGERGDRFEKRVAKFERRSDRIDRRQDRFAKKCLVAEPAAGCAELAAKIVPNLERRIAARTANVSELNARCAARPADNPCGERAAKVKEMLQERIADLQGTGPRSSPSTRAPPRRGSGVVGGLGGPRRPSAPLPGLVQHTVER